MADNARLPVRGIAATSILLALAASPSACATGAGGRLVSALLLQSSFAQQEPAHV